MTSLVEQVRAIEDKYGQVDNAPPEVVEKLQDWVDKHISDEEPLPRMPYVVGNRHDKQVMIAEAFKHIDTGSMTVYEITKVLNDNEQLIQDTDFRFSRNLVYNLLRYRKLPFLKAGEGKTHAPYSESNQHEKQALMSEALESIDTSNMTISEITKTLNANEDLIQDTDFKFTNKVVYNAIWYRELPYKQKNNRKPRAEVSE